MTICVRLGIIIFILMAGLNAGKGDSLYKPIKSYLSKYRQTIRNDDINIQNGIIRIEINGRRTNIKSQLLLGFFSVGRALQRTNTTCREVQVIIHYELKMGRQVFAKAPVNKVMELTQGRLSPDQFFMIIEI